MRTIYPDTNYKLVLTRFRLVLVIVPYCRNNYHRDELKKVGRSLTYFFSPENDRTRSLNVVQ